MDDNLKEYGQEEVISTHVDDNASNNDIYEKSNVVAEETAEKRPDGSTVIRAKNSHLPVAQKTKRSKGSVIFLFLLIVALIALFVLGIKYMNSDDAGNTNQNVSTEEVGSVRVNIYGDVKYEVLENGSIIIDGIKYTPQYDEACNIVSYIDEKGNQYEVYEITDSKGNTVSYIDIKPGATYTMQIGDVKVTIIGTNDYEVLEDNSIVINNIKYTPQYDEDGNIVSYINENGVKFEVYEVTNDNGTISKYIDITVGTFNTVRVKDVKINISGDDRYEIKENGSIVIGNIEYTPKYDEAGNTVAYIDIKGNEYKIYETIDSTGAVVKYIDINSEKISSTVIKDVKINIVGSSDYKVLEDGGIEINGIKYTPKYDEMGTIIAYVDKTGHEYKVFEVTDETGITMKTVEIYVTIPNVTIEMPSISNPNVDIPAMESATIDNPTVEVPTIDKPVIDEPSIEVPTIDIPTVDDIEGEIEIPDVKLPWE